MGKGCDIRTPTSPPAHASRTEPDLRTRLAGLIGWICALWLSGCASPPSSAETRILPAAKSYLRVAGPAEGKRELQIAVRRLSPEDRRGPSIWLVGVSHIGDPTYYRALQALLETNQVVLYEGVGMDRPPHPRRAPSVAGSAPDSARLDALEESLQGSLARALGLVFQLTAIDYSRSHFRNSDLSKAELQRLVTGPESDESAVPGSDEGSDSDSNEAEAQFNVLMQALEEGSWLNSLAKVLLGFIESSPQMRGVARLAMIEMLGTLGGDFETLAKANPGMQGLLKVLVDARNARVLEDVAPLLKRKRPPQSIAIFYGAAHMKDFEARLGRQFRYLAREEHWFTAFDVDLQASRIGTAEQAMIRSMIQWQLESLRSQD